MSEKCRFFTRAIQTGLRHETLQIEGDSPSKSAGETNFSEQGRDERMDQLNFPSSIYSFFSQPIRTSNSQVRRQKSPSKDHQTRQQVMV